MYLNASQNNLSSKNIKIQKFTKIWYCLQKNERRLKPKFYNATSMMIMQNKTSIYKKKPMQTDVGHSTHYAKVVQEQMAKCTEKPWFSELPTSPAAHQYYSSSWRTQLYESFKVTILIKWWMSDDFLNISRNCAQRKILLCNEVSGGVHNPWKCLENAQNEKLQSQENSSVSGGTAW